MQRAWTNTVNPGIIQDRSVFLTPEYMVDILGAFSDAPHKYDLAWHMRGTMTTSLTTEPHKFPEPVQPGYGAIGDLKRASTGEAWTATAVLPNQQIVRFLAPGGTPTEVFTGTGHYFLESPKNDENPAAFFQRREGKNNVLFASAVDLSGEKQGFIKSVTQEGSLESGYGLMKVETGKGTDLCFTAFRPGTYTAAGLSTDALQAFVRGSGANAVGLYLAGGKTLKLGAVELQRSEPGLAYVEKTEKGYTVGNPSPDAATVTVTLPPLAALKPFLVDEKGQRTGPATITTTAPGTVALELKAGARVEFAGA